MAHSHRWLTLQYPRVCPRATPNPHSRVAGALEGLEMYTIQATTHTPRERLEGRSLDVGVPAYSQKNSTWTKRDKTRKSPAPRPECREGPYPERKATRYSTNFIGMKSTPDRPPTTTDHDEPASVTYMRT